MKMPTKTNHESEIEMLTAEWLEKSLEIPVRAEPELFRFGQILFGRLALMEEDFKAWERVQNLRLRSMRLALSQAKSCAARRRNYRRSWARN